MRLSLQEHVQHDRKLSKNTYKGPENSGENYHDMDTMHIYCAHIMSNPNEIHSLIKGKAAQAGTIQSDLSFFLVDL